MFSNFRLTDLFSCGLAGTSQTFCPKGTFFKKGLSLFTKSRIYFNFKYFLFSQMLPPHDVRVKRFALRNKVSER